MVLVDGEETSYRVKDGKRAVLILFGTGEFRIPRELSESQCELAPFGGPHEITLDFRTWIFSSSTITR
jgi:hypothetical protein